MIFGGGGCSSCGMGKLLTNATPGEKQVFASTTGGNSATDAPPGVYVDAYKLETPWYKTTLGMVAIAVGGFFAYKAFFKKKK